MDSTLYWLWLAEALGSGCRLASRLLEEYPDPAELYGQVKAGWNPPEYLSAKAREFMQAVAPAQMAGLKKRCDDLNIFILTPDSADYPQRHDQHYRERYRPAFIQCRQTQEYYQQGNGVQRRSLRAGKPLLIRHRRPLQTKAVWQLLH